MNDMVRACLYECVAEPGLEPWARWLGRDYHGARTHVRSNAGKVGVEEGTYERRR